MKCKTKLKLVYRVQDDLVAVRCSIPDAVNRLVALGFTRDTAADMVKEWLAQICWIEDLKEKYTCNECGHVLTKIEKEKDCCARCGHPYHDETIG